MTAAATMSEWPLRCLVALWTERSNPCSGGRKFIGLAKVLSMIETSLLCFANSTTASRSGTCMSGFEIVSIKTAFVFGRTFFSQDSGSFPSMKVYEMPNFSRSLVTKSWVPPYRQSWARRWSLADSTVSREVEIAAMPLAVTSARSEEHTSELQSHHDLV